MLSPRPQHRLPQDWQATPTDSYRQRAITLVELLLVMVLLVVVGSLATPLLEGSFSTIRLRRATDHVLAAWSQARTRAIEAGVTYEFRFQPKGNSYRVKRWSGALEIGNLGATSALEPADADTAPSELEAWTLEETLPEQITFSTAESVTTDELGQRETTRLDQQTLDSWYEPVLFFPDGTTSESSLLLSSSQNVFQRVTLRSLTGIGRASELLTREEVDRQRNR
ncbi:MAG: hypothetical protein AAGD11_02085 [Planctomycetota bacterium]